MHGDRPAAGHAFVWRHIGPRPRDIAEMCRVVGCADLDELIARAVPAAVRTARPLDLPPPLDETEAMARLADYAARNRPGRALIGMGYYGTRLPAVLRRNVLEAPGWYTAYTPYQSEVSQGRLEALMVFQTMVADLTGMEVANASLLDEATAAAEAMTMARRVSRHPGRRFFVDADTHPQTKAVVRTRARFLGLEVVEGPVAEAAVRDDVFGALLSYPGSEGEIRDPEPVIAALHARGAVAAVATDLLALTLLKPPGEMDADIVLGSAQRFGLPMGFGGPHAAFFASRLRFVRQMPGRIIGLSRDARGRPAYRMALQTREQHIRREKATSNICTAQSLPAILAGLYAVWHGPEGLRAIAERIHGLVRDLAATLRARGLALAHEAFFDTLVVETPGRAREIHARAGARDLLLRDLGPDRVGLSLDETADRALVHTLAEVITGEAGETARASAPAIPAHLARTSPFLRHPVFHEHRSETAMMRYLRRLQDRDVALDRAMIPLGSCTMKLNAAAELEPILERGFAHIHPFVPAERAEGYRRLLADLERWLCEITGFDAVSFQPNAGSQGEYAGLLVIRAYHESRGEGRRDVCLVPASAHGTNPASAVLAGLRPVTVACREDGDIDLEDLEAKARAHADRLAAVMVTYPSTHGVFEEGIRELCAIVHRHGGQVYMDGANLNALVGLARPAELGADVAHLNLHKTFAIPHGGGGPGMGPIGVRAHLAPFLPDHPVVPGTGGARSVGTVAAAPFGSPMILPISWAYVAMMGGDGLTLASKVAILNANYVAHRLDPHFPVVFRGRGGFVAHECILDFRAVKRATGLTAEDAAKRLADFGFHAPTMNWPVPESMMVEPTESEPREELDRFCEAMIVIREEIRRVERGEGTAEASPLRHAPHPAAALADDPWPRAYDRRTAAFPLPWVEERKYWPPVARVDNVWGDRHLVPVLPLPEGMAD